MKDFHFYAPTEVCFGVDAEKELVNMVKKYAPAPPRVLIHYGGGSAVRSGLIDRTKQALDAAGIVHLELGGVMPNPRLSMVHKGIDLCRKEGINLILAVGGGSVIDSSKAIAYGVDYDGDVWDFYIGKATPKSSLPVGCILTIPAAGSEMSDCTVITNEETKQKFGYSNDLGRLKFAIMNPMLTMTLPPYQTACGAVDMMMHTMERYFTKDTDMDLQSAFSEAIVKTVLEAAYQVLFNPCPDDHLRHRATLMWASSWAHNDLTGCRNTSDFATHKMEHELSALFDVAHGAGLAALWPSWARYVMNEDPKRFAAFALNALRCVPTASCERDAINGIERMEDIYRRWGMPTSIPELLGRRLTEEEIMLMANRCTKGDTFHPGYFKKLDREAVASIYRAANQ